MINNPNYLLKINLLISVFWLILKLAFSVAGNTITKTRNRLHPETARASLCAKSWIDNSVGEKNVA